MFIFIAYLRPKQHTRARRPSPDRPGRTTNLPPNRRICVRSSGRSRRAAGCVCAAGRIWRHGHRCDGLVCGVETCYAPSSRRFHRLAAVRNCGPGSGGRSRHNRSLTESRQRIHGRNHRVAAVPDSNVPRAAVYDFHVLCIAQARSWGIAFDRMRHAAGAIQHTALCAAAIRGPDLWRRSIRCAGPPSRTLRS